MVFNPFAVHNCCIFCFSLILCRFLSNNSFCNFVLFLSSSFCGLKKNLVLSRCNDRKRGVAGLKFADHQGLTVAHQLTAGVYKAARAALSSRFYKENL